MIVHTLESVDEAVEMMGDGVIPLAGATDLLVRWPENIEHHGNTYLDLSGVASLRDHRWEEGALVLGALTTYWGHRDRSSGCARVFAAGAGGPHGRRCADSGARNLGREHRKCLPGGRRCAGADGV